MPFSAYGLPYPPNPSDFGTFLHKLQPAAKALTGTWADLPADLGVPPDIPAASLTTCARRLTIKCHSDKFLGVEGAITMHPQGLSRHLTNTWIGPPTATI